MSLLVILIVGGIIGWIGARVVGRDEGVIASIIIGIVGGFIGSILARVFNSGTAGYFAFSWAGVIWTLIGAIIFAAILNSFQHGHHHSHV
jgi:uncharacterized membrane protein YeaQ/YmgE (transglycosylase-associated protein family)